MKKYCLHILILLSTIFNIAQLQAKEAVPDDLQLRLGAYILADQSTDVKLSRQGLGATINLQDIFEMEETAQVLRFDGYYRFTPKHAVEFSWYRIHNSSYTDRNFQWADQNISINGELKTFFNTDIYKVNYLYSFYHTEKVELALAAGVHITAIDVGFSGNYTSSNNSTNSDEDAQLTAPLPVVGFRLQYNILPKLSVKYAVDYFFITFDGIKGSLNDSLLTVDYRVTRHFGMGVGLNTTRMRLEADIGDKSMLHINHDIVGGLVYATFNY